MVRKSLEVIGVDPALSVSSRVRDQAKSHLSRRINLYLQENRMLPAELARKADLPRDSISRYILKKSVPTEASLRQLAKAMGCDVNELVPNRAEVLVDPENANLELVTHPGQPGRAWLRLSQSMSMATAQKIIAMLHDEEAADGKRGR